MPVRPMPAPPLFRKQSGRWRGSAWAALVVGLATLPTLAAWAAAPETPYPFEGTWARADRPCTPKTTLIRTYTAHDVISSLSHCSVRRIASGSGGFELLEDCHQGSTRPQKVTEVIRMTTPDSMVLKRQIVRLKIPRPVRYNRCTIAAPITGFRPH